MAYTGNPSTVATDAVRLLVGDISSSTSSEYLADADYTYFIAQTPNHYAAAALAARSLAALFFGEGGTMKQVGDLRLERDPEEFSAMATRYDRMSAMQSAPFCGGISRAGKRTVEAQTDRVTPAFVRNQFDNPDSISPTAVGST